MLAETILAAKIRAILDESFVASPFNTKADFDADRLRRIQELIDEKASHA